MKKWTALLLTLMLTLIAFPLSAEENTHKEILSKIVEVANENEIPAEIMIAIASKESGAKGEYFRHYDENGDVIETDDGGIGLMQITELKETSYSKKELEDIENNIRAAAEVLNAKWGYIGKRIPEMKTWSYEAGKVSYKNDEEDPKQVIENWYFPVMAYNGLVEQNIPKHSEETAYQDEVFKSMADQGQLFTASHAEQIESELSEYFVKGDTYNTDGVKGIVSFPSDDDSGEEIEPVKLEMEGTYTRMNQFEEEQLITFNRNSPSFSYVNVYDSDQLTNHSDTIGFYNNFSLTSQPFLFNDNDASHYGYYTVNRNGEEEFIASSNLISTSHPYANSDFSEFGSDQEDENGVVTTENGYVTVKFDEKIADDYVSERNFYLKDENDTGIEASLMKEGVEVRVTPSTVEKGEVYTLYVHKVRDEEGNMAKPVKQKVKFE
ncbi:transglycosylase SLT domain-containing protein [Salimicrobium halophilum]|uniref:Transglycosylase SLT domain-containing protein n=1 Tax=Salimicrobium halophilum TaxID=86666 RepID=A0A1G8UNK7_9BACI|nr:transglycosylase SLT domain-containing protein [Salimicrobium halophilum]SDJ55351.1 Transglycosylase SLT domain-containing protein [Salimicrobium halophilum]